MTEPRPLALLTGLGRRVGIAAGIAERLARDGWNLAFVYSAAYDDRVNGGADDIRAIEASLRDHGADVVAIDADLAEPDVTESIFEIAQTVGPVAALVLSHAESVNSGVLDTTVESFDRHFAVNARASWLLIREFARRFDGETGSGRIVAMTSDAIDGEVAYGASKGALDRIVVAAAREFAATGITANLINPGPIDTGWMSPQLRAAVLAATPRGRLGTPTDIAALVAFLLSAEGGWVNGQLLKCDGGISASA